MGRVAVFAGPIGTGCARPPTGAHTMRARFLRRSGMAGVLVCWAVAWTAAGEGNLLVNGDFAKGGDGWRVDTVKGNAVAVVDGECQYTVVATKKGSDGQVGRSVPVTRGVTYRFQGDMKSSKNGTAYFQIKQLSGKELRDSIGITGSGPAWKTFTKEFMAETNQVQIIARFKQNPGLEGTSGAFRNLSLEAVGEVDTEKLAALEAQQQADDEKAVAGLAAEAWLAPGGQGDRSGRDRDNAADDLAKAWNAVAPGGVVHVLPGRYEGQSVVVTRALGGREGKVKTLKGESDAEGAPLFVGNWTRENPAGGLDFVTLQGDASHVAFENLRVEDYRNAFVGMDGNVGLTFRKLTMRRLREGVNLSRARDVVIEDMSAVHFTKRAVRIRGGSQNIVVRRAEADAGGEEWAVEPFHMGFAVGGDKGTEDKDIRFEQCVARNSFHKADGKRYWNADGFCAEGNTRDITWIDCAAFDCTDGGWDIKTKNGKMINCVAFRNKRNFRVWSSEETLMENCIAGYAIKRGGSGTEAGIHVCGNAGKVRVVNSTIVGNGIAVDADQKGVATLDRCLIVTLGKKVDDAEPEASVKGLDTCTVVEDLPAFPAPDKDWDGKGKAFDRPAGVAMGYRSVTGR